MLWILILSSIISLVLHYKEYDIFEYSIVVTPQTDTETIGFLVPNPHPDLLYFIGIVLYGT